MKRLKAMLAVGLSLTTCALADDLKEKARKIDALYKAGLVALNQGKGDEAKAKFQAVLKINPRHGHARYQMTQIPAVVARVEQQKRKALFTTTKLGKVHFGEATLEEALEALNQMALEATDKKFSPNFVIQDPSEKLKGRKVSIKLNNVPISVALKHILEGAGASARYDQWATVIRPATK